MKSCKLCGRQPEIEISDRGDGYYVSCIMNLDSGNPHYINMIGSSEEDAKEKWDKLMGISVN